ncbi:DUF503 domain-containing protein [Desulfarculales bacterium]
MVVGILMMTLHVQAARNLKAKRKVSRAVIDRVRAKFNAAACELGAGDLWQRLELGFAVCSNEVAHAQALIDEIGRFVERLALAEIVDVHQEVTNLKDMAWALTLPSPWEA